ncbi:phage/plasmid primase, P4 family [Methylocystis sp. IM3]|uniref:DNA primase family protein n=1 Tax=unclassified Methylocystis TaxID=2625913 RepID=UPI0030F5E149
MRKDEIPGVIAGAKLIIFPGQKGHGGPPPVDPPKDGGDLNRRLATFARTDLGNSERFQERFRGQLLHCQALGWLAWDGRRWSSSLGLERVEEAEQETVRAIRLEADAIEGTRDDYEIEDAKGKKVLLSEALRKHGRASEARSRVRAISDLASCRMSAQVSEFDRDPMRFNVENGTLVFRRGDEGVCVDLLPHNPADMITKVAPVVFDPEARCDAFNRFLEEVQPEETMRRFLAQWCGYSLTGNTSEQKLCFFYGKGNNGKSVFVETFRYIAGDYGDELPIESFLDAGRARIGGQATPDLAELPGVRCLTTTESEKGAKLAEALVKQITGGDRVKARHLNRDYFSFMPQLKLTAMGNYRPEVRGTDEGIWRRIILVPWGVTIPKERRDLSLSEKLRAEASGILNLFLAGLKDWLEKGLLVPQSALDATAQYREDSDPLGRFLAACTEPAIGERVASTDMHHLYCVWAKANGERAWTPTGFGKAMRDRGIPNAKSSVVYWVDVRLTKCASDFQDHQADTPPADESSYGATYGRDDD